MLYLQKCPIMDHFWLYLYDGPAAPYTRIQGPRGRDMGMDDLGRDLYDPRWGDGGPAGVYYLASCLTLAYLVPL